MKSIIYTFIFTLFLGGCELQNDINFEVQDFELNGTLYKVEVAKTLQQRKQGLMGREKLEKNHGMLFIFEESKPHSFWMKNTKIPLQIIWLDKEKNIVETQVATPCKTKECPVYIPKEKAKMVLEVNPNDFDSKAVNLLKKSK